MNTNAFGSTKKLAGIAVLVAIIILLQAVFGAIPLGPFTITLTMVPIVIGAALYGPFIGAFLGAVFGIVVSIQVVTGAAGAGSTMMLEYQPVITIVVCIVKGLVAGLVAGLAVKSLGKKNLYVGIIAAAILAPLCNTGIFTIALITIFRPLAEQWAQSADAAAVASFIMVSIIGVNFVIELTVDLILSPVILRIIQAIRLNQVSSFQ